MKVKVLASGSKGNSTLIRTSEVKVLIDIGINYQTLASELEKLNLTPNDLDAILITHTHSDHIKGLQVLVKKTNLRVYALEEMLEELSKKIPLDNIFIYENPFKIVSSTFWLYQSIIKALTTSSDGLPFRNSASI